MPTKLNYPFYLAKEIQDPFKENTSLLVTGNKAVGSDCNDESFNSGLLQAAPVVSSAVRLFGANTMSVPLNGVELMTAVRPQYDLLSDLTLDFWFYRTDNVNSGSLGARLAFCSVSSTVNASLDFDIRIASNNLAFALCQNGSYSFNTVNLAPISLNQWYYLMLVQDRANNSLKLYLDGVLVLEQPYVVTVLGNKLWRFSQVWNGFSNDYRFVGYYADIRFTNAIREVFVPTKRLRSN